MRKKILEVVLLIVAVEDEREEPSVGKTDRGDVSLASGNEEVTLSLNWLCFVFGCPYVRQNFHDESSSWWKSRT